MTARFTPSYELSSAPVQSGLVAQTYGLLFIALLITVVGVMAGAIFALPLLTSGWIFLLFFAELGIIWTAPRWVRSSPLNYLLFGTFPFLSGLTVTPLILSVATGYANGELILLNALLSTGLLTASAAVLAATTRTNLGAVWGRFLLQALIGLIIFGLLQMFFPGLRGEMIEMIFSAAGIVIFSLFLAVDFQRLQRQSDLHSPFLLAISLYLDIFNLFLFVLRFMLAIGGRRN